MVATGAKNWPDGSLSVEFVRGSGISGEDGSIFYSDRDGTREYFAYNAVGHTSLKALKAAKVRL
jgi:hypothetical protein